jgi:hypothetical protein
MKCPIILFCLLALIAITTAVKDPFRPILVECLNKALDKENSEFKLSEDELQKFKEIVDREVRKEGLVEQGPNEKHEVAKEVRKAVHIYLPNVSTDTVDKIFKKLREASRHCPLLKAPVDNI